MTETNWIPGSWGHPDKSRRVKLVMGDSALIGVISIDQDTREYSIKIDGFSKPVIIPSPGIWHLFVEERKVEEPKVELPIEPGWYIAYDGLAEKEFIAQWRDGALWFGWPTQHGLGDPEQFAPFTRLEPVPVTAKRVLERVFEILPGPFPNEVSSLAREFGIQS